MQNSMLIAAVCCLATASFASPAAAGHHGGYAAELAEHAHELEQDIQHTCIASPHHGELVAITEQLCASAELVLQAQGGSPRIVAKQLLVVNQLLCEMDDVLACMQRDAYQTEVVPAVVDPRPAVQLRIGHGGFRFALAPTVRGGYAVPRVDRELLRQVEQIRECTHHMEDMVEIGYHQVAQQLRWESHRHHHHHHYGRPAQGVGFSVRW